MLYNYILLDPWQTPQLDRAAILAALAMRLSNMFLLASAMALVVGWVTLAFRIAAG
jgi:hypothetical protein